MHPTAQNLVIYSDSALLVVNKPAGLPTLVDGYNPDAPYLVGLLKQNYNPLWTVHRLDKDTSGVIVFARTAAAHRHLNTQFEQRQANKIYHALVFGSPPWETLTVDLPLRADGDRKHRTVVDAQRGKPAVTDLRVLERLGLLSQTVPYTVIEATPHTGRTHQIRVHLASQGYPIVADPLYGPKISPEAAPLPRLALHARSLKLVHPDTGTEMHFEAPYPQDFAEVLSKLHEDNLPKDPVL
jgi:tRNA pseudouridine32 synthase/23S rRNA pseudouridine746 synthase